MGLHSARCRLYVFTGYMPRDRSVAKCRNRPSWQPWNTVQQLLCRGAQVWDSLRDSAQASGQLSMRQFPAGVVGEVGGTGAGPEVPAAAEEVLEAEVRKIFTAGLQAGLTTAAAASDSPDPRRAS